ncbi:MAG: acyltransferase family protein [Polaromonas sp.]|nr:acyltransferase family protein [Polaromonas sp.]
MRITNEESANSAAADKRDVVVNGHHPDYRADIDGLRAVAVLSVIAFHAFPTRLKGGFVGVDVFFVISGYLISTIILGSMQRGSFSFLDFYTRRIKRIFPALFVVLFASLAFGWFVLLADEYKQLGKHIAGGGGFVSNILLWNESGYFDTAAEKKPLLHLWSLGIEEQFYIVWPLLLWIAWKAKFNLLAVTLVFGISSFAFGLGKLDSESVAAFYSPLARFWELLVGATLAHIKLRESRRVPLNNSLLANSLSFLGAVMIGCSAFLLDKTMPFPGWWAVVPTMGTALIIYSGTANWLSRWVLSNPVMVWIGLISFPLYLWHWPLLAFPRVIAGEMPPLNIRISAVVLSAVLAWLTYRLIERPVRFGRYGNAIGLIVAMAVTAGLGYRVYLTDGLPSREVALNNADIEQTVFPQANPSGPCTDSRADEVIGPFCRKFMAENSIKTIVIWGDSSAAAWQTVFLDIAKERNYTVVVISHEGCSPLLNQEASLLHIKSGRTLSSCQSGLLQQKAVELIEAIAPDAVVHIAAWNWLVPDKGGDRNGQSVNLEQRLQKRIVDTVNAFDKVDKLIVFKSWPLLPKEPNYRVSRTDFLQSNNNITVLEVSEFNKDSQYIHAALEMAASSNTEFFSPSEKICTDKCRPIFEGVKMYTDAYHISPLGSMKFRPELMKLLDSVQASVRAEK